MDHAKKITIFVPEALLKNALSATGQGITATIKQGLELVSARRAYKGLRKMRGKVDFSIDTKTLREDR
ncbi:MAG: hypothetical protein ABII18_12445 [bacterium]|nr:hypothetical protein [bacterium]MBU1918027.1 hypothetical protein [bacterium]